jgi:hypothetical protein
MNPKFIAGPPGTGKTHDFITKKYSELFDQYGHTKIVVLSHTNVAADQIREAIADLKKVKDKGIKDSDLEDYICTIHSYCKNKLANKDVFDTDDHMNLTLMDPLFNKVKIVKSDDVFRKHGFYKFLNDAHSHGYHDDLEKFYYKSSTDRSSYEPFGLKSILYLKDIYEKYKTDQNLFDFMDMIQEFIHKAKAPDIDALIVDEAQDSNKPQIKALEKMATNVKDGHYYMIGDADQTIFEFAGSDPEYFHKLSKEATELEQGKRCGETINSLCKKIIAPIWKHYGYTRKWLPAVYTDRHLKQNKIEKGFKVGDVIKGKGYYLPDLESSGALNTLLDKIKNTNQTFLFTYRQTPCDKRIVQFFKDKAIEFSHVKHSAHVSKKELTCHYVWSNFIKGKPMELSQIKSFWDYMGSKAIVRGKSKIKKPFEDWINKEYTVDELIKLNCLNKDVKQYESFDQVRVKVDKERLIYINNLLKKGFSSDTEVRVKYGNIHDVKGLTFDNVIVDESLYRDDEPYYVQLRLKYTAYSRGIFDYWTLCSKTGKRLGVKNGRI